MIRNAFDALNYEKFRFTLYKLVTLLFAALAIIFVLMKGDLNFVVSDGRGYYVYMPSLLIDNDLDFSNQIRNHWDVDFNPALLDEKTSLGYVRNKYPIGLALSNAPSFALAHVLSLGLYDLTGARHFMPNGYSSLYQLIVLFTVLGFGYLMFVMIDRMMQSHFNLSGTSIGLATLAFWSLSHFAYYFFREPIMVHVVSGFWVTASLYWGMKVLHSKPLGSSRLGSAMAFQASGQLLTQLGLMFMSFALAIVCRPTNAFVGFFVLWVTINVFRQFNSPASFLKIGTLGTVAAWPIFLQALVWKTMTGSWISYSYNSEGFSHFKSPYLLSTLFSSLHGLFFWAPVLLFSVIGFILQLRKTAPLRDHLLTPLLLGALALWYLNSSWHQWWFGDAFGARSFLELAPLFVFGLGFFFTAVERFRKPALKLLIACLILACGLYTYALMALYIARKIPRADYLF